MHNEYKIWLEESSDLPEYIPTDEDLDRMYEEFLKNGSFEEFFDKGLTVEEMEF